MMEEPCKAKNKRVMEPFAISPTKNLNAGKPPFDKCSLISKLPLKRGKAVDCLHERIGKSLMKVKNQRMMDKPKKARTSSTVQEKGGENQTISSDDEDNTMSDEDFYLNALTTMVASHHNHGTSLKQPSLVLKSPQMN